MERLYISIPSLEGAGQALDPWIERIKAHPSVLWQNCILGWAEQIRKATVGAMYYKSWPIIEMTASLAQGVLKPTIHEVAPMLAYQYATELIRLTAERKKLAQHDRNSLEIWVRIAEIQKRIDLLTNLLVP